MLCLGKTGVIDIHGAHFLNWRHAGKQSNSLIPGDHMRKAAQPDLRVLGMFLEERNVSLASGI